MYEDIIEEEQWLHDEITGLKKKSALSILNKERISKEEMDELFT